MEMYRIALKWAAEGRRFVVGTVVHAQGSTPQKAGAKALLDAEGNQVGTVGGGLVEARAFEEMGRALEEQASRLLEINLDEEYSRTAGPICGGAMKIFALPQTRDTASAYASAVAAFDGGTSGLLVTDLSTAREASHHVRWVPQSQLNGNESFPSPEFLAACLKNKVPACARSAEGAEAYVEPVLGPPKLLIVGGGHVGQTVAAFAYQLGFRITVLDDRPEYTRPELFPEGTALICKSIGEEMARYEVDSNTYIVLVSKGHKPDAEALEGCIHSERAYLGMIGSRRKIELLRKHFIETGIATAEEFDRVAAPIGFDIGAVTVPEIGVSIAAQLVEARRGKTRSVQAEEGAQ